MNDHKAYYMRRKSNNIEGLVKKSLRKNLEMSSINGLASWTPIDASWTVKLANLKFLEFIRF